MDQNPEPMPPDTHAALRSALKARVPAEAPTDPCLDDDTLAALAEGSLDASSRARAVLHLAECPHCRSAVASVACALADRDVAREAAGIEAPRRPRRWAWVAAGAAAVAVLALMVGQPGVDGPKTGPHRAPTIAGGAAPRTLSPAGVVAAARELRWSAVAGADRYRVTLYDASGRVRYEVEPADTVAALPDSLRLRVGERYLWKVDARTGIDRWVASGLTEFSIGGSPAP